MAFLEQHKEKLDEDCKRRMYTNPLRVLDSKNPEVQALLNDAPALGDYLDEESREHFAGLCKLLESAGIFGSQYTQLVARRVRELGVYCELWAWDVTEAQIRDFNPSGIILSGGPESTTEENSPRAPQYVFEAGVPVFGVCYGMQTMAMQLGGHVEASNEREFGYAQVEVVNDSALVRGIEDALTADGKPLLDVWMSHGDKVTAIPSAGTRPWRSCSG